jgi:hypothetical protein
MVIFLNININHLVQKEEDLRIFKIELNQLMEQVIH